MQKIDWIILAICFALILPIPAFGEPIFACIEEWFARFSRHKGTAIAAVGAAAILMRVVLLPWMPVPQPKVHDEFSYLLAADTFSHGRLANPTHPLWIFFDTFHVIQHPTYASMYPPAQGTVLAVGKVLGNPWMGVLLSVAAMCMAVTWMLQGWMPPAWALLGGVLVLSRVGVFSYWMNSYWGGAVAATGAALALGALPRIWKYGRSRNAIIFGAGAAILATSRPIEGFIFFVPLFVAVLYWALWQEHGIRLTYVKQIVLPMAGVLACAAGFVAFYNWRVTGSPIVFPHFIEGRSITTAIFLWQRDRPSIAYANPQFDDFYHNFLPSLYQASWPAAMGQLWWKLSDLWQFYVGPALSIPMLALPWVLRDRRNRLLLFQIALSLAGLWVIVYYHVHYAAPLMATLVVLMMQGMRVLRRLHLGERAVGVALTRVIVLFSLMIGPVYFALWAAAPTNRLVESIQAHGLRALVLLALGLITVRLGSFTSKRSRKLLPGLLSTPSSSVPHSSSTRVRVRPVPWTACCELLVLAGILLQICVVQRNAYPDDYAFVDDLKEPFRRPVELQLAALPGEHLVLVRYSKDHNSGEEYVYNDADIDRAKTVWAREIPGIDPSPILNYFRNRDVWVFEPDVDNESIAPYTPQNGAR